MTLAPPLITDTPRAVIEKWLYDVFSAKRLLKGKLHDGKDCPLARTIASATGKPVRVSSCITVAGRTIESPDAVWEFANKFDRGGYPDLIDQRYGKAMPL